MAWTTNAPWERTGSRRSQTPLFLRRGSVPVQCKTYPLDTLDETQSHIPRMHSKSRDIDHPRTHACTNQRPASLKQCHLSNVCANGASRKHRLMANQPRRCLIIELSANTMRRHIAQTSCTISKSTVQYVPSIAHECRGKKRTL